MIVVRNTYPIFPKCPHAAPGDEVRWSKDRGRMSLVRISDGKTVFSRDLLSPGQHDGDRPICGVVASVVSKGWFLELSNNANT
jgi:hypothetical protein